MMKKTGISALAIAAGLAMVATSPAGAVSGKVREACGADYKRFCPQYEPNSTKARQCMRSVGKRLSVGCIDALADAGEIKKPRR